MRSMARWAIAVGALIGLVVPKVAYACSPPPTYWHATITNMVLGMADLPNGITVTTMNTFIGIKVKNNTDSPILIGKFDDAPIESFNANTTRYLRDGELLNIFYPEVIDSDGRYWGDDKPELPNEVLLIFHHDNQQYEIPVTLTYDLEYYGGSADGCSLGMLLFAMLYWFGLPVLGIALVIALIIVNIKHYRANRRAS